MTVSILNNSARVHNPTMLLPTVSQARPVRRNPSTSLTATYVRLPLLPLQASPRPQLRARQTRPLRTPQPPLLLLPHTVRMVPCRWTIVHTRPMVHTGATLVQLRLSLLLLQRLDTVFLTPVARRQSSPAVFATSLCSESLLTSRKATCRRTSVHSESSPSCRSS